MTDLQRWLNDHGASLVVDGKCGPATRAAIGQVFTSHNPPPITDSDIAATALRLGCSPKQVRAVSIVESGGKTYDANGRPKMLFERHLFHRLTDGRYSTTDYSNATGGGYSMDSWAKLEAAACKDADAAFASASWGRFQVLGTHWRALEYISPIEMAYTTVTSEAASLTMLARYVKANGLAQALRSLSANPETCRAFARGYNGPGYEKFAYHTKLARAMQ